MKYIILIIFGGILLCQSCTNKPITLFTLKEVQTSKDVTLLDIDEKQLSNLRVDNAESVEIVVPFGGKTVTLELKQQELFTPDFRIMTDRGQTTFNPGLYYEGKIKGDPTSIVNVSIFNNEVNGVISTATGMVNIGKAGDVYMMADPEAMGDKLDFTCHTPEEGINAEEIRTLTEKQVNTNAVNNCVSVDFEMSYSNYQQFGSVAGVSNWITSIFSSVKTLYRNDGIEISIKSIYVWTTPDGYSTEPATALNQLRAKRLGDPAFTGSTTLFVRGKTGGFSGIAYLGVNCLDQYNASVADVQFGFNTYPTYSWTVMVLCHEMGHNFGSAHTHSCNWLHPDGTRHAIDGCGPTAGYSEGSCPIAPIPAKGTIMSYCQLLSNGISLALGFGPLPGNAIRAHIGATTCANCGTPPPPTPTCTDGIKNQNEEKVDCGGICPACPNCNDKILNNGETSIDCGGPNCPPCPVIPPTSGVLISQGKPTSQSSTYDAYSPASDAVDGSIGVSSWQCTTKELQPWWQLDLNGSYNVSSIELTHRTGCPGCVGRIKRFRVFITANPVSSYSTTGFVYEYISTTGLGNGQVINIPNINKSGRYVRVWCDNGTTTNWQHFAEVKVFSTTTPPPCTMRDTTYRVLRDSIGQICR